MLRRIACAVVVALFVAGMVVLAVGVHGEIPHVDRMPSPIEQVATVQAYQMEWEK